MKKISVVVPCYNEEESLPAFYEEINRVSETMKKTNFEFIFINDGSKDNTLNILRDYAKKDKRVRYISFSRNFFKEAGLYAGLKESTGDYVVVMDADLQDPPALLPQMVDFIEQEGYDIVATKRATRKGEKFIVSVFSRLFYAIMNKISDVKVVSGARDFRMMTRQVVDAILELSEYSRFSKGIFEWVGFNTKWLAYDNIERVAGDTKINFKKRFSYAIEGFVSFSTAPLVFSSFIGLIFCLISFLLIIFIIVKTLVLGDPVSGWPSTICIIFFVSGIQLFCTGIIGQYLAKTYLETKKRPIYIVKETEKDLKK